MKLAEIAVAIPGARIAAHSEIEVRRVIFDSRRAGPGDLFVAIHGANADGADFALAAINRGAVAIVSERELNIGVDVGQLVVPSARRALGEAASALLGYPSERLRLVGVTGTDGKTTTTHLIAAVLAADGRQVGRLSTVDIAIGDVVRPNPYGRTTPEASDLQEALRELVAAGVEDAVLEVSSHALALDRVSGCTFDAAVFTNLAPEHLDFHGTMEAYAEAKARLFGMLDSPTVKYWSRMGIVNADDPYSFTMIGASPVGIVSYGLDTPSDVMAVNLNLLPDRTQFKLVTPLGEWEIVSRLRGRHNVYNWLAAAALALGWNIDLERVAEAAEHTSAPPGRLQDIVCGQPFRVVVDFAHTPQALAATLGTLQGLGSGRLYLVFGMAGQRDARNRPEMGRLAADGTHFFIISTDDPIDEDPAEIADQIAIGAQVVGAQEDIDYAVELDRRLAIQTLLKRARPGDTVLLAGKGHEDRMLIGDRSVPWSDVQVASEILAELGFGP